MMTIVRPPTGTPPETFSRSIFLAGPSPRDGVGLDWRTDALSVLADLGWNGVVFAPLPENGKVPDYDAQVEWEQTAMGISDLIVFWVPRSETLPGFTTNVEFGVWFKSGKALLGLPPGAPKTRYLETLADQEGVLVRYDLRALLADAIAKIGPGAARTGGEREVPLQIWTLPAFQGWLKAQKAAGNRLDGAKTVMTFRVGPKKERLFLFALHVDVHIGAEGRNKTNEIVIFRPDVSMVVAWSGPSVGFEERTPNDLRVAVVKEFRSPAAVGDCFVREVPGGSSAKPEEDPLVVAAHEVEEETGLVVDPSRLSRLPSRQVAATLAAHKAHVWAVELTPEEMDSLAADKGVHGVEEDTERTFVEVRTVRELLADSLTDWATLGMIFAAIPQGWFSEP